jgi:hypothetical protein
VGTVSWPMTATMCSLAYACVDTQVAVKPATGVSVGVDVAAGGAGVEVGVVSCSTPHAAMSKAKIASVAMTDERRFMMHSSRYLLF